MKPDADVIILGGGCAGLSLATALANCAPRLRVVTFESRTEYTRDRTWCFWQTQEHAWSRVVSHRWNSWRVRHAGREARQCSSTYSYQHVPANAFYDAATQRMKAAGQVLVLGLEVGSVRQQEEVCLVETNHGVLRASWIFDSRPPAPRESRPVLEQRFIGWHVRTESPCFDPDIVDLMDFAPCDVLGRTAFVYVLPYSGTEALVEATFLDAPQLATPDAEALLTKYLKNRLQDLPFQVLYCEKGTLPMGGESRLPPRGNRIVPIGTRGGRVKASSGYAFQRIQVQSQAIAQALGSGRPLPRRVESRWYGVLDRLFLTALRRSPHRAPDYFFSLFQKLPADLLVRFLSETAHAGEIFQVMLALPAGDFLQATVPAAPRRGVA